MAAQPTAPIDTDADAAFVHSAREQPDDGMRKRFPGNRLEATSS